VLNLEWFAVAEISIVDHSWSLIIALFYREIIFDSLDKEDAVGHNIRCHKSRMVGLLDGENHQTSSAHYPNAIEGQKEWQIELSIIYLLFIIVKTLELDHIVTQRQHSSYEQQNITGKRAPLLVVGFCNVYTMFCFIEHGVYRHDVRLY